MCRLPNVNVPEHKAAIVSQTKTWALRNPVRVGRRQMGEVYRARDPKLERDVAIKVPPERWSHDPDALSRFEREAKAAAALSQRIAALSGVRRI